MLCIGGRCTRQALLASNREYLTTLDGPGGPTVPDPNHQTETAQFRGLLRSFAFDPGLIAGHLLGEVHLARVIDQEIPRTCARIFTPLVTLATFLAQIASDDHSCQAALDRLLAWRAA